MIEARGNLWTVADHPLSYVVIPINIGWRSDGTNVMGRGVAAQAARRWPEIQAELGDMCIRLKDKLTVYVYRPKTNKPRNLIFFPTKPLDPRRPFMSWKGKADIALVEKSLQELATLAATLQPIHTPIYITDVGCGNGSLRVTEVRPLIEKYLGQFDRVIHVVR